ncbi:hypothetical protein CVD28_08835 [Bacillus sp. M6-12]|uniref:glycosyltransferase family 4 protein n=1 Tax=Bacillus sp. M6-12 TaxID=2054166 RepID=UPI000C76CDBE|nr:glycosyltransferase family 4 protein [Bacillus sp. M6-12]PLS17796.1 hypothetical protein CVD28_08835 [Bacillus sp. M6-12]
MRILYISTINPFSSSGGKVHFLELGNSFVKNGHEVVSIMPCFINNKPSELGDEVNFDVDFIKLKQDYNHPTSRKLGLLLYNYLMVVNFSKLIKKYKPDFIYSRSMLIDVLLGKMANKLNIPYLVEVNGDVEEDRKSSGKSVIGTFIMKYFTKKGLIQAKHIISVSEKLSDLISNKYNLQKSKISTINNGVNTSKYYPMKIENIKYKLKVDGKFVVGFAGILSKWQGIDVLPKAVKKIPTSYLNEMVFVIVGDGPMKGKIEKEIKELNLQSKFILTGMVNEQEYIEYINQFDICLLTYPKGRNENLGLSPIKLYSYMACRKPLIGSDVTGVKDVIETGNCGYVYNSDNIEDLAQKITLAYNNRDKLDNQAINSLEHVRKNFSWDRNAEKVIDIVNK